jgi:hypothetical protein
MTAMHRSGCRGSLLLQPRAASPHGENQYDAHNNDE